MTKATSIRLIACAQIVARCPAPVLASPSSTLHFERRLVVLHVHATSEDGWAATIGTALRELTADSPDTKDLCNPKLESVVLKEEGHIDRGEEEGDDWPMLVRAFKYRYEKGRPIKSLSISSCDIQKEYVDDLKVYTEVDWDGVEVYGDDDDEN